MKNLSPAFRDEPAVTPHPKSVELAEQGLEEWSRGLPEEDAEALADTSAGKAVRWAPGNGWVEEA